MWKQIRGQGLSYSYSVFPSTSDGLLYLTLYRATNVVAAYKEARNILVGKIPCFAASLIITFLLFTYFLLVV